MRLIFISLALLVVLPSCTKKSGKKDITFGFLLHALNNRWEVDVKLIEERSKEKGINCIIKVAEGSASLQVQQAEELVKQGVDVLAIVAANQNRAAQIVRMANKKKIPIIAYDRLVLNCDLNYLISFNYFEVGEMMADYAFSKVNNGNVVLLYGDANDANAIMVEEGIERVLKKRNKNEDYNIIFETYVEGWSYDNAKFDFSKVANYFTDHIDAVIACNVPLALSVVDVLEEKGFDPSETIITAQDMTDDLKYSIKENGVSMSVVKPIKQLAYGVVDMVEVIVNGNGELGINGNVNNRQKDVKAKLLKPFVVDVDNIDKMLN